MPDNFWKEFSTSPDAWKVLDTLLNEKGIMVMYSDIEGTDPTRHVFYSMLSGLFKDAFNAGYQTGIQDAGDHQPPRPFKYKMEAETSAKGDSMPHLEINSDDKEEVKVQFEELWTFLKSKTNGKTVTL